MTKIFPKAIMELSECYISCKRIQTFLLLIPSQINNNENNDFSSLSTNSSNTVRPNNDNDNDNNDGNNHSNNKQTNHDDDDVVIALSNITCYWTANGDDEADVTVNDNDNNNDDDNENEPKEITHNESSLSITGETTKNTEENLSINSAGSSSSSHLAAASLSSSSSVANIALLNINLNLKRNKLYCIIGKVGSGKSALLQAISGELPYSTRRSRSSSIKRNYKSMSYASQDPWIMNGTIRDNIIMGLPYNDEWYNKIMISCGLNVDIQSNSNLTKYGDMTIVGDRGIQCSGGQRARIGLARALYRNADLILLDDPLSAVDIKVAKSIYYNAIQKLLLLTENNNSNKCVVLVTHQHQFISSDDDNNDNVKCILMDNGMVSCIGSYSDCVKASNGTITKSLQIEDDEDYEEDNSDTDKVDDERQSEQHDRVSHQDVSIERDDNKDFKSQEKKEKSNESNATTESSSDENATSDRRRDDDDDDAAHKEDRNTGIIKMSTWIQYAKAMGSVWVGVLFFVMFSVTQASLLISIVQIGTWAERPPHDQDSSSWLGIIIGLTCGTVLLALIRARMSFFFCIRASKRLHDSMTKALLRSKIEFFDTNPSGRILNRFSADIGISDELLPLTIYDFLVGIFMAIGSVATAIVVLPFILLTLPPLIWYFLRLRRAFVATTREVKRLEGLGRSPIYSMLSEALNGIATIRANNAVTYFKVKFEECMDTHTRAVAAFVASSRWFATRMDFIAFILMSIASCLAVLFDDQGWFNVNPAVLGLSLTMLLQLAGTNFPWIVRQSAEIVNQMVSVERVAAYGNLASEAPLKTKQDGDLKEWPCDASVAIDNLTVRYRSNLPPALSGISFEIKSGEKIGVVGRTGSGKSSLVQALFRILEAEEGRISMGGVDIANLGLHKLRKSMSVIPQTPVLFSGCTIRENLDPFGLYSETAIRVALADVQMLKEIDENTPDGLNSFVAEDGSNFSVGQRQLLCLARAVLRKNKLLVLDEPTANVDTQTDSLLQKAVSKSFEDSTILSVAHRLDTIIDNDRILVLGNGKILEYGTPQDLLAINDGHFASMVANTGEQMSQHLRKRAQLKR